jgi:hypothetical protein
VASRPNGAIAPKPTAARRAKTPASTAVAVPEKLTGKARAIPSANPKPAPLEKVVLRLVYEAVAARIRHRALLLTLQQDGEVTRDRYFESYKAVYDRDHDALIAQMMLNRDDFLARFDDWHNGDLNNYGIPDRIERLRANAPTRRKANKILDSTE